MFERLKQLVRSRRGSLPGRQQQETPVYECQNCGTEFPAQRQECAECGGFHIERAEW